MPFEDEIEEIDSKEEEENRFHDDAKSDVNDLPADAPELSDAKNDPIDVLQRPLLQRNLRKILKKLKIFKILRAKMENMTTLRFCLSEELARDQREVTWSRIW